MSKEPNKFLQNALSEINNDISPSGEDENDYLISSKKKAKNDSLLDQDVQDP